jgi:group I intron endonuclease
MSKIYCIYKHTSPSGKSYIGQTKNYKNRCREHQKIPSCPAFHNAIKKHGWENFKSKILIEGLTLEEANYWEEFFILEHKTLSPNGYNLNTGGGNPRLSEETIERMRQKQLGTKMDEAIKQKISIAHQGKKRSSESVAKMKASKTGVKMSDEFKEKCRIAQTGRKHSEETKAKIRAANKGYNGRIGTRHTEETKAKMSASAKARWALGTAINS